MKRFLIVIILIGLWGVTSPFKSFDTESYNFYIRSLPSATIYLMRNQKLETFTRHETTKRYQVINSFGSYYVVTDGVRELYLEKSQTKLFVATPLSTTSLNSANIQRLIHDYFKESPRHIPYEYEELTAERAKEYADFAISGNWYIPSPPYKLEVKNIDTFDWHTEIPISKSNSYPFQIQYLTVLNQVSQAYIDTGDVAYLKYGMRIVKSWTNAYPTSNYKQERWAFNDQGTAIRTFHLLNFWDAYKSSILYEDTDFTHLMLQTLYEHGTLLATSEFYKTHHNHGIFQDMALTAIAQTFPQFDKSSWWLQLSNSRLDEQIRFSITSDGVHLEHSPGYQVYMYNVLARFLIWADDNNFVLPSSMSRVKNMPNQLTYLIKPNGTLPIFGDTSGDIKSLSIVSNIEEFPELSYATSQGKEGKPPNMTVKQISNQYSFMREYWTSPTRPFNQATQIMMTAGYHSNAHKHADDLTIDIYGFGRDFIIETGRYGYTNLPERQSVFGVEAHNTVHRDGENLDLNAGMRKQSKIISAYNTGLTSLAVGESKLIGKNAIHRRTLVYDNQKTLVVYDKITSPTPAKYVQRFHLAKGLMLLKSSISTQEVLYGDTTGRTIQIMQLNLNHSSMRTGTSFVAVEDYEWEPRSQVISYNFGKDVRYLTLIRLDNSKVNIQSANIKVSGTHYIVTYTLSNKEIKHIEVPM